MKQKMKIKWKRANLDNLYLAVKKAADENGVGLMENCSEIQTTSVAMEEPKKDTEQKSRTDSIKKKVTTSQNQQL
ncbi:unnamed protein product [Bursaphelenchus okinawaensis]|uniref:Uncharacterized protein n=1 Tax=Bursaphelenchus okinawaensis TaxID=465554 RepID=A0A811JSM5_9BILA|nr:unnamed protein product [Bursaphelenchus okinawaensis]CAG9080699.1 unnamed protein product [Bursaphelenchus okinawaensis]